MKSDYQHIEIESTQKTSLNVKQSYYMVSEKTRNESICRVLDLKDPNRTIIFCQTKKECDLLLKDLTMRNYSASVMHGDIAQNVRIQTLDRFKNDSFKILIATDVAARGIHVDGIDLVINYNMPQEFEAYIHRIGRTGRADSQGEAISFISNREFKFFKDLEKFSKTNIEKKELPTKEEIIKAKYNKVLNSVYDCIQEKDYMDDFKYIRSYNKDELMKIAASLLKISVDEKIGSDFNKDLTIKDKGIRKVNSNHTRVFLTIGKLDNLKKGTLLDFMKKETSIDKDCFHNIEILTKFTFLDVDSKVVDKFMKKMNNKKLNNRIIRVEIAKNQK